MRQIHRSFEANHLLANIRTLITTTSVIEGIFSQLRRRLRRIGALQSPRAADKWALAFAMRINGMHLP
jgi:transposase-like protein